MLLCNLSFSLEYLTLSTHTSDITLCGLIPLTAQSLICLYFTVIYTNSLLLFEHYLFVVYVKSLAALDLVIEHPLNNQMDPYWTCFYSIETSNWHTTLLSCLHVITQVILVISSLLVKPFLFMINNALYCLHLPAILGLTFYLSLSITIIGINY